MPFKMDEFQQARRDGIIADLNRALYFYRGEPDALRDLLGARVPGYAAGHGLCVRLMGTEELRRLLDDVLDLARGRKAA